MSRTGTRRLSSAGDVGPVQLGPTLRNSASGVGVWGKGNCPNVSVDALRREARSGCGCRCGCGYGCRCRCRRRRAGPIGHVLLSALRAVHSTARRRMALLAPVAPRPGLLLLGISGLSGLPLLLGIFGLSGLVSLACLFEELLIVRRLVRLAADGALWLTHLLPALLDGSLVQTEPPLLLGVTVLNGDMGARRRRACRMLGARRPHGLW